jgi:tetratricopeptide (TPR) repeat protein
VLQGTRAGKLPLVKDATDLDVRVHQAVAPIPYVQRDIEEEVSEHLRSGRPVLLVGSSMVGKSRMAVRLIRDLFPDRGIVIPDSMDALASLDAADVALREMVIFLDDINRLIGSSGITDGALHQLIAADNIIIGTIRAAEYDHYQPTDEFRPPEWDVVSVFERVVVSRDLSPAEEDRLTSAVGDRELRQRITMTGLGEYVGGAERIKDILQTGPSASPAGYALVQGAADWQRAGMQAPIPVALLRELGAPHLPSRQSADLSDDSVYDDALQWATRDINPTVALLQREKAAFVVVFDYALDILTGQGKPIPDTTWPILIQNAEPDDIIRIGYAARVLFEKPQIALQAWRAAANSGSPEDAPGAEFNLGLLLAEQGDVDGAKAAYQRAIDSGHPQHAPNAAFNLGNLLTSQGDLDAAFAAYRAAIHSTNDDVVTKAAVNVAVLLEKKGNLNAVQKMYQQVIDSGHRDQAPKAAVNLGMLLDGQGDVDAAKAAYQQAIDSGHSEEAPRGAFGLGLMLQQHGDINGAKAAYQRAIDSSHPEHAPAAQVMFGTLLAQQGDKAEAQTFLQQALNSGPADIAAAAAIGVGLLLAEQGNIESAKAAYQRAIDSGDPQHAPVAANLLRLLEQQGN